MAQVFFFAVDWFQKIKPQLECEDLQDLKNSSVAACPADWISILAKTPWGNVLNRTQGGSDMAKAASDVLEDRVTCCHMVDKTTDPVEFLASIGGNFVSAHLFVKYFASFLIFADRDFEEQGSRIDKINSNLEQYRQDVLDVERRSFGRESKADDLEVLHGNQGRSGIEILSG